MRAGYAAAHAPDYARAGPGHALKKSAAVDAVAVMVVKNVFRQGCSFSVVVVDPTLETAMVPLLFPGGSEFSENVMRTARSMGRGIKDLFVRSSKCGPALEQ